MLLKKETADKFKKPEQRKAYLEEERNKIHVQLALLNKQKDDTKALIY